MNIMDEFDIMDDEKEEEKEIIEPGEQEFDLLTAVDFNLEDTTKIPVVDGEEDE